MRWLWSSADKFALAVFPEVAKFTRVCAYDRPGTPVGEKRPSAAADHGGRCGRRFARPAECRWRGGALPACRPLLWRSGRQALCEQLSRRRGGLVLVGALTEDFEMRKHPNSGRCSES